MRKSRPRRDKKYKLSDDIPVDEFTEALIEVLGEQPAKAKAAIVRANTEGLSLDAWLWKTIADGFHQRGVPLAPKLRKQIAEHPDMPEALRKRLLTRDLN